MGFSWAAFTLPFFWAVAYGVWLILTWWLVSRSSPSCSRACLESAQDASVSLLVGITVAGEALTGIVRLWAGANAHTRCGARKRSGSAYSGLGPDSAY
jgi:hypothetical protein